MLKLIQRGVIQDLFILDFKTSHVKVNPDEAKNTEEGEHNFKTSHVKVNPPFKMLFHAELQFQNIPC